MGASITSDYSDFYKAVDRLYKMGDIRKRDITAVFRTASRPTVNQAKRNAPKSTRGGYSLQYPSRNHPPGFLKKNIRFKASKKYRHVYYVNSGAWYSMIYITGHGSFRGHPFMDHAISSTEGQVHTNIRKGLFKLIGREWDGR